MRITAYGRPITQGSKVKTRWGAIRDANSATLKPWRDNVRSAALDALGKECGYGPNPVTVQMTFTFPRPGNHYGTGRNANRLRSSAPPFPSSHSAGDLDKVVRACFDSLTDAGTWRDDSQVVVLRARKVYVGAPGALDRPGVVIDLQLATAGVGQEVLL